MFTFKAGQIAITLNANGCIASIKRMADGSRCDDDTIVSPLARVVCGNNLEEPSTAEYDERSGTATLRFVQSGAALQVRIEEKEHYAVLELAAVQGTEPDTVIWGPFATTIGGSVGESVGVVHDGQFAIGLQCLNIKTVGGWPLEMERLGFVQATYSDSSKPNPDGREPSDNKFEYEDCAAWPTNSGGSLLQAFARDRTREAHRPVWNLPKAHVQPAAGEDALVTGARIALFGCPPERVLDTLEAVELGEDLPHPLIEGVWGKKSPAANQSYLITDFTEATMEEAVRYAKAAGLGYVYHPDPFDNWGHFELKRSAFPNGDASLKAAAALAAAEGVGVGIHTLTNFTTRNDPYVTPALHERLQTVGTVTLLSPAGADDTELVVSDPEPFRVSLFRNSARLGAELIEYAAVSAEAPWKLTGVKRGVAGTTAAAHEAGVAIGRLWDHPYDVFFPDLELQDVYSRRIAELMNDAGLRQISFDGLEGLYATGQDGYGVNRFVDMCYRLWQQEVINDASIVVPNYLWHVFTRFNWGEPWGAHTREGQLEWRLSNQRYFARNFIPPMLGWFLVRSASDKFEATALDEIEWVLSKAAGFNAGFALVANMDVLQRNGNVNVLLDAVREWETARRSGAFTPEQRQRLQEAKGDWHLEAAGDGRWKLYPVQISRPFTCSPEELQPGQPGGADWAMFNSYEEQPLRFCLRVIPSYGNEDASIARPAFYTDGVYMTFDTELAAGQYLVCDGNRSGYVYDSNWNLLRTVEASADAPSVRHGGGTLSFSCRFEGNPKPSVSVKVYTRGEAETVSASLFEDGGNR